MTRFSTHALSQLEEGYGITQRLQHSVGDDTPARRPLQAPVILGKPTSDIDQGNVGNVEIWFGADFGLEQATGELLFRVLSRTQDVKTTDFVYVFLTNIGLEMNKAIC